MSVQEHTSSAATTTTSERSVYQSLFDKINLSPVASLKNVDAWQSDEALSDAAPAERVTAAIQVLVSCLADAAQPLERLDKTLLDEQIARLDNPHFSAPGYTGSIGTCCLFNRRTNR